MKVFHSPWYILTFDKLSDKKCQKLSKHIEIFSNVFQKILPCTRWSQFFVKPQRRSPSNSLTPQQHCHFIEYGLPTNIKKRKKSEKTMWKEINLGGWKQGPQLPAEKKKHFNNFISSTSHFGNITLDKKLNSFV